LKGTGYSDELADLFRMVLANGKTQRPGGQGKDPVVVKVQSDLVYIGAALDMPFHLHGGHISESEFRRGRSPSRFKYSVSCPSDPVYPFVESANNGAFRVDHGSADDQEYAGEQQPHSICGRE
jgi:hypothetical protein